MHPTTSQTVHVVGGGLAGVEATWQLASRGVPVHLIEMRPSRMTPAHHTAGLAELVCSNSFKSDDATTAAGSLKRELEALGSLVLAAARESAVPAGAALAVDRSDFSAAIERALERHPLVSIERAEARELPEPPAIIATGPLTSEALEPVMARLAGERLAFFDAAAPIVEAESLDRGVVFAASRYGKGGGADYLNAPLSQEEYERFIDALLEARRVTDKVFDRRELFSACQPVEEIARSGRDALRFGPLKPVGLTDPRSGLRPWAVVQLRPENAAGTAYNLVGFQTNLAWGEQQRVFRMIPGLEHAEFSRHGVMHRNTFVDAPKLLSPSLELREHPGVWLAGQLTGTEGYLEAAASGLLAGVNVSASLAGLPTAQLPADTLFGSLVAYATDPTTAGYQPMHVNYGIVPPLDERVRGKRERYAAYARRAADSLAAWLAERPDLAFAQVGHAAEEAVRA